jgi:hypothetical protein
VELLVEINNVYRVKEESRKGSILLLSTCCCFLAKRSSFHTCHERVSLLSYSWLNFKYSRDSKTGIVQGWDSQTLKLFHLFLWLALLQWKTLLEVKTVIIELGEYQPSILIAKIKPKSGMVWFWNSIIIHQVSNGSDIQCSQTQKLKVWF